MYDIQAECYKKKQDIANVIVFLFCCQLNFIRKKKYKIEIKVFGKSLILHTQKFSCIIR
jgi:hypothetical protein